MIRSASSARDPAKAKRSADIEAETAAYLASGGKIDSRGHGETAVLSAKKQTQADRAKEHAAVMQKPGKPVNLARKRKYPMESL